ncbi:MAG: hypothetical protein J6B77_04135, partial [Clostridia bacterium]|nr:hypothetical protein [Clostridia bacterium]
MNKNRSKSTISFLALILCIAVFMTGCGYSKLEVDEKIADVSEQIEALKNSIPTLEKTDEDLGRYIDALEETAEELDGKLAEANTAIETLRRELLAQLKKDIETSEGKTTAKVTVLETSLQTLQTEILKEAETIHTAITALKEQKNALEARIVTLKAYTDEKLTETADWATATFSTLEQYEATQTEIATVKENIRTLESDLKVAEERLNEKIKNDIAVAIDALREELSDDYVARIEAAVSDVTDAYSTAIEDAKKTVTGEYRTAIAEAIKDSESSMEAWVNKTLADGYYDIATIDAKLAALNDALSGADEGLQKQIDAQIAALDAAKKDLTDAYTTAITEAIETNNGVLRAEIAQAVADAAGTLETRLAVIDNAIAGIQAEITAIKSDITSILSQLEALKNADVANRELIDQLKKDMERQLEALQIQINCLKGDHVIDGEVVYTWSADQSTCTATATCVRCGEITETVLSVLNGTTYTATFTNDCFATQTAERKVARITGMTVVGDTVIIDEATKTIIAVIPDGVPVVNFTIVATGENFHLMDDSASGAYRFYIGDQYLVFESRYAVSEMKIEMPVSAGVLEGALKYSNDGGATTVDTGYYFRSINAADYVTTVTTLDELKAALAAGGNVKLGADLAISEEVLRVEAGVSVVLDLAGKKITTTDATSILNLGTLTVKDSVGGGEISASSDVGVAAVINNGALTVEGGAIVASYAGIHNLTSGALTVKGGDISAPFPIELAGGTFALVGDAFTLTSTESGWGEIAWYGSEIDLSGVTGGEVAVEPQADGLDLSKITLPTGWKLY